MRRGQPLLWAAVAAALLVPVAARAQYLFYTDTNAAQPSIRRCGPNGADSTSRPLPAYSYPEGMAFDPIGNRLYWVEAAYSGARIRTCSAGFTGFTTIVSGIGSVRSIAVDGVNGWIYWTSSDQGSGARIERARLMGTQRQTLFVLPGFNPRQITIDPVGGKVYWAEFELDAIARCNLDGSVGEILGSTGAGSRPYGLAVQPARRELWLSLYGTDFVGYFVLSPAPAAITSGGDLSRVDDPQDLAARSAALVEAAHQPLATLAPTGLANVILDPTHLAIDVGGNQLFISQAGVHATSIQRMDMANGTLVPLPVVQTTFGGVAYYGSSLVDVPGGDPKPAPVAFALRAPNPARGNTTFEFGLPAEGDVALEVIDMAGRRVASLAEGLHAAGVHHVTWTGETGAGHAAPGMYLVRLKSGSKQLTRRFAYLQ